MHYAAKRFFAPVMISCCEEGEITQNPKINEFLRQPIRCGAKLNVANETLQEVKGTVVWSLRRPDSTVVKEGRTELTVPALASAWVDPLPVEDGSILDNYLSFSFLVEGETVSHGSVLFCAPKHFRFVDPCLKAETVGDEIIVNAEAYAKSVCLESDDPDMLLSDNFFDMDAGQRCIRLLRGSADGLRVRSVYNIR
jgi:beta-mannosidase